MSATASELGQFYNRMFEQRREVNPSAFDLPFWQDHFAFQAPKMTPEITGRVLDLGCGTGEIDVLLASARPDVHIVATDISSVALSQAIAHRSRKTEDVRSRLEFHKADIASLPFPDASFDSCLISHVAQHLANPTPVFSEISRVLRPGGYCLVTVTRGQHHADPDHKWHLEPEQWQSLLERYGEVRSVWTGDSDRQVALLLQPRRPRVVAMYLVKDQERYLPRVLDSITGFVDAAVVLDDGSTDRTPEICQSHPNVGVYERHSTEALDEATKRDRLLQMALSLDPDWLITLDGAEQLEAGGAEYLRNELGQVHPLEGVLSFDIPHLGDQEDGIRFDGPYANAIRHARMFRVNRHAPQAIRITPTSPNSDPRTEGLPYQVMGADGTERFVPVRILHHGIGAENEPDAVVLPLTDRTSALTAKPEDLRDYYTHARGEILERVPLTSRRILELGCATGALGRAIKERQTCFLAGIEIVEDAARIANRYFDMVHVGDAETMELPYEDETFDTIICADVLEHLVNPNIVLERLYRLLAPHGTLIVSIPNIRNLIILSQALDAGRWEYQDEGILDRTHLRFFTRVEFEKLLHKKGFRVNKVDTFQDGRIVDAGDFAGTTDIDVGRLSVRDVSAAEVREICALQMCFIAVRPLTSDAKALASKAAPAVSVVLVAEDGVETTLSCLQALITNTPESMYEVIVVDNGTNDTTAGMLSGIDGSIRIVRPKSKVNLATARNLGAEHALGKWLVFMSTSVQVQPNWLDNMLAEATTDVYSAIGTRVCTAGGETTEALGSVLEDGNITYLANTDLGEFPSPSCSLVKREDFEQVKGFDDELTGTGYALADLSRRLPGTIALANGVNVVYTSPRGDNTHNETVEDLVRYWEHWIQR